MSWLKSLFRKYICPHWFRSIPKEQLNLIENFPFRFECVLCGVQSLGNEDKLGEN